MTSPHDHHTVETRSRPGRTATGTSSNTEVTELTEVAAADIEAAAGRIAGRVSRTPLLASGPMSDRTGATLLIKAEHRQLTGSFKLRGAMNKVFALPEDQAAGGIVTASSGNHGIGVATAAATRGVPCMVYLPAGASQSKVDAIARLGATIVTVGGTDTALAEAAAGDAADDKGLVYISPYNDRHIIAGQGTIAAELVEDVAALGIGPLDAVVAAVGGGGLISGIASGLAAHAPGTVVIGASPANDRAMAASVAAGTIVAPPATATFSDGTAGAVEPGSITFPICRDLVDRWTAVSETEIAMAVANMIDDHHELVEGAAGVALAAAERYGSEHPGSTVAVVSCGANVSSGVLRAMLVEADRHRQP